ncbi:MAG TPA: hypothetical protein VM580_22125 [Labilithrix sp.]|nr:hypothetical protein [Labilithrix sp.]
MGLPRLVVFGFPVSAIFACGPSFQAIYEGNARFEHCYALEENPHAPMTEKAACWRDWSEHYTYGQTRDRIYYATARYVALSEAPTLPTDEAMMMAAPGETPRVSTITAPTPTSAFEPPPKVLDPQNPPPPMPPGRPGEPGILNGAAFDAGVDAVADAAVSDPPLPAASCSDKCGTNYRGCAGGCETVTGGKKPTKACDACLKTYRTCMRQCFK